MIELSQDNLAIVRSILKSLVPEYEIWAFGSRIAKTARKYSDLDLAIITDKPLDFSLLGQIRDTFSASDLPIKVDVLDWSTLSDEFKGIISSGYEAVQTPAKRMNG